MANTMQKLLKSKDTKKYFIFEEADGWHISPRSLPYLDARGRAYPSVAAARRAAQEAECQPEDNK